MSEIILFEGIDGSGKTTIIGKLKEKLESEGRTVVVVNGPVSKEAVEGNIKNLTDDFTDAGSIGKIKKMSEILSFSLDRIDQFNLIKRYKCANIDYILADRSFISAFAYQYGEEKFNSINRQINFSLLDLFGIQFDYIIFIDTLPSIAVERIKKREAGTGDKSGKELEVFLTDVMDKYTEIFKEINLPHKRYHKEYFAVNGNGSLESGLSEIYKIIQKTS